MSRAAHNFIRMKVRVDRLFTIYGQDYLEISGEGSNIIQEGTTLDMTNHDEMTKLENQFVDNLPKVDECRL